MGMGGHQMSEEERRDQPTEGKTRSRKIYGIHEYDEQSEDVLIEDKKSHKVVRSFGKWLAGVAVASLCVGVGIGGSLAFFMPYGQAHYREKYLSQSKMGKQAFEMASGQKPATSTSPKVVEPYENGILPPELDGNIVSIAKNIGPCVVSIYNNKKISLGDMEAFYSGTQTEGIVTGMGSGVIFDQDPENYYIITNCHVVEGADSLAVNFIGDVKAEAKIVGKDSVNDIAVVRVEKLKLTDETMKSLGIAALGDSDKLEVGQLAVAIGTPATGALSNTVTTGIISGISRQIVVSGHKMDLIQTSAAINSGNSGGALVGPSGEVIGINVAKTRDTEGIGFAIPINQVKLVVAELMQNGLVERPGLGIMGIEISQMGANVYGLPIGIYIQSVIKGGSADLAGIQPEDVLVQFEGTNISTMVQLKALIAEKRVGDIVEVKIVRNGEPKTIKLELKVMPES